MSKAVHQRLRAVARSATTSAHPALIATLALSVLAAGMLSAPVHADEDAPELNPELKNETLAADEGPATAYYRWIDGGGRIQYTDFEPAGVPAERIPLNLESDDSPMLTMAAENGPSDPFHDQDQQILPIEHIGPCADARRQLAILHAALPVYLNESGEYRNAWRGDAYKGRRSYLDAESRTEAVAGVRRTVLEHCSDPEAFAREEAAFQDEIGRN